MRRSAKCSAVEERPSNIALEPTHPPPVINVSPRCVAQRETLAGLTCPLAEQSVDLIPRDHRSRPLQRPIRKFSSGADEAGIGDARERTANADAFDADLR